MHTRKEQILHALTLIATISSSSKVSFICIFIIDVGRPFLWLDYLLFLFISSYSFFLSEITKLFHFISSPLPLFIYFLMIILLILSLLFTLSLLSSCYYHNCCYYYILFFSFTYFLENLRASHCTIQACVEIWKVRIICYSLCYPGQRTIPEDRAILSVTPPTWGVIITQPGLWDLMA